MTTESSDLLDRWAFLLDPPRKMHADEWGEQNIRLPRKEGMPGPYRMSFTPYLIPFARAFDDPRWRRIVFVVGSQAGKTRAIQAVIGKRLDHDPAPIIYYGPTKTFVERTVEPRIVEMLRTSKPLRDRTLWGKKQRKTLKLVNGAPLILSWASSASELAGQEAALVLVDERDRIGDDIEGEGDPVEQAQARVTSFADGKVGIISTPKTGAWVEKPNPETGLVHWDLPDVATVDSPIIRLWWDGTRHEIAWPCPDCGEHFIPRSSLLEWSGKIDGTATPGLAKRTAALKCPHCGVLIAEDRKPWMLARLVPVAPGQRIEPDGTVIGDLRDTECFSVWASGLCNPFPSASWGSLAARLVSAQQSGEPGRLQAVFNTAFGELFQARADPPKFDIVLDCRLPYRLGQVPYGVQRVAMTVDVQKAGVYFVIRGWGARWESWLIRCGFLHGATDEQDVWDALEAEARAVIAPGIGLNLLLIDSGYRPGDKWRRPDNAVYDFCRRFGKLFCRPIKGRDSMSYGKHMTTSDGDVDARGKPRKFRGLILHNLNTDYYKTQVHERITRAKDIAGGWHLPEDTTDEYAKQIVSETRVVENNRSVWQAHGPNHFLDCEMMQFAAAELMQVHTLQPLPTLEVCANDEAEVAVLPNIVKATMPTPSIQRPAIAPSRYLSA